jgi:hypothetical protein
MPLQQAIQGRMHPSFGMFSLAMRGHRLPDNKSRLPVNELPTKTSFSVYGFIDCRDRRASLYLGLRSVGRPVDLTEQRGHSIHVLYQLHLSSRQSKPKRVLSCHRT